jgi:tRNA threonylcarbamoyladenosine biosynthesis protein TsaB
MKILAVDASTDACSAALLMDGEVHERYEMAPQQHTRLLMPMVHELLAETGNSLKSMDAYAFGQGPGSFTGLRIAIALVQGLAMGTDRPVIGISTLAALAQRAIRMDSATQVAAALDARMGQVYWGLFQAGASGYAEPFSAEAVLDPAQVPRLKAGEWMAVGNGWSSYRESLLQSSGLGPTSPDVDARPRAGEIARLAAPVLERGGGVPPAVAEPVYLRQQVARKIGEV